MFSRARRLLVVVGSLSHFERFGVRHWRDIATYVCSDPRFRVDVSDTEFRLGGLQCRALKYSCRCGGSKFS